MPNFGEPDAGWTDEYPWTRYRGAQPYPCPADWVLGLVEGDGIGWHRYPGIAEGHDHQRDVVDLFDDYDAREDAHAERATLLNDIVEGASIRDEDDVKHELSIDGETVFVRIDPEMSDLMATVAEVLARYSGGEALGVIADGLSFSTGRPPARVVEQNAVEQREEQNQSLTDFGVTDDA